MVRHTDRAPIGVVIPAYGHPQFLAEAVISACEQTLERDHKVVVVDDGCKFVETGRMVGALMERYPETLYYFRQKNTGLPGARNAGVRFLMKLMPELDSVYFLDADNRIAPYSLQAFRDALGEDPEVGWAYPDISMFGLSGNEDGFDIRETAPDYCKLKHLVGNISEAGSLVRAKVFQSGVFYNETMTSGFEDWDFWLSALEAGFKGRRAKYSGFMYRRRPESMLAQSRRLETTLIAEIRKTHRSLYQPKNILLQEHQDAPVFAIHVTGSKEVLLTSDPTLTSSVLSIEAFRDKAHQWSKHPHEYYFPERIIIISPTEWARLQAHPISLRWTFWQIREHAPSIATVSLVSTDEFHVLTRPEQQDLDGQKSNLICIQTDLLRTALLNSMEEMTGTEALDLPDLAEIEISTPHFKVPSAEPVPTLDLLVELKQILIAMLPMTPSSQHRIRRYTGPSCLATRDQLVSEICAYENRRPFPVCSMNRRAMIFVPVEHLFVNEAVRSLSALLRRLKTKNFETLVVLEATPHFSFAGANLNWAALADDIVPLTLSGSDLDYKVYLGRRVPLKIGFQAREDLTVLARSCDLILGCGMAAGLEVMGEAKVKGATGYVWLDTAFLTGGDQQLVDQANLLAFEHAITGIVSDKTNYIEGLSAEGFPPSKFQSPAEFWQTWAE